jgi:hypothetical protein
MSRFGPAYCRAKPIVLTEKRYGRLTVECAWGYTKLGKCQFICKCDCGNRCFAVGSALKSGTKKSCGCLRGKPNPLLYL